MKPVRGIDRLGERNYIHDSVVIQQRDPDNPGECIIGDCNEINENVKILVGPTGFRMGDYNVLHNGMFITGDVEIGHNCWFGQGTHLDGTAGLTIGNGVTMGFHTHVWSHAQRGALLDGCTLRTYKNTIVWDNVWLVGNNIHIAPGVLLREGTIVLSNSVVTHSTDEKCTYGGVPTKKIDKSYWREVSDQEKSLELYRALKKLCLEWKDGRLIEQFETIEFHYGKEVLIFSTKRPQFDLGSTITFFDIGKMTYTKRLTGLEVAVIRYLSKESIARFVPE